MTTNEKQGSGGGSPTRKQRRAAERAAHKKGGDPQASPESSGRPGRPILAISIAAVAIGLVLVAALVLLSGGFGDEAVAVSDADSPAPADELRDGRTLVAPGSSPSVHIEVFEDPKCPHCQNFTERTEPLIIAKHVKSGTASFTYNDYIIFQEDSVDAAVAMRAADELDDAFWDYHHVLFHNAPGERVFTREWLADIAEHIGLDRAEFEALLDDETLLDGVAEDMARGADYEVTGTPAVVVNGQNLGNASWEDIDAAIENAAAGE